MEKFRKLGLSTQMLELIEKAGFTEPSEIQEKAIPLAMAGKDIIGGSATGSGKTLAFGAPIIEKIERGKGIQALVLTPTRELAEQVAIILRKFSRIKDLRVASVYGGVAIGPQVNELERAEIVVGTPGRILDHMERGTIALSKVGFLVLDEADRMLDMGFVDDVEKIIKRCPSKRQTLLFSATISQDIQHIAKRHMISPVDIAVESHVDPTKLEQIFYDSPQEIKFSLLVNLLKHEHPGLIMVFCNTRHNTDFVAKNLENVGIEAIPIHGGLTQSKRNSILASFRSGKVFVLVCTDVAARGLDIKGVSHVYNYDLPPTSKEYIHRIGRTARAGKEGKAISILSQRDYMNFRKILEDDQIKIKEEKLPETIERVQIRIFERPRSFGGRGGDRGGRSSGSRSFGGRSSGGDRGGGRGRSFGGRSSGGGRSFGRRDEGSGEGRGERKSFGDRGGRSSGSRSFGGRSSGGDRGGGRGRSSGSSGFGGRRRY